MITLREQDVDALAPNAAAIKNGHGLVKKGSFVSLYRSEDGTLLFGACKGSGKTDYQCSADFVDPDQPVVRCSCPSRQFPCKHGLGLLYAYVGNRTFEVAEIPQDILDKRDKAEKREERKAQKATEPDKPKKVNKTAWKKKMNAQLEGLALLEQIANGLVQGGLGTTEPKTLKIMEDHVKQLGNYYVPGAQMALRRLVHVLQGLQDEPERTYTSAMEQLIVIHALVRKGQALLKNRLASEELQLETDSTIEEWLGHAWQLTELRDAGLVEEERELLQLAFLSYDDQGRNEYVDLGYWLSLDNGQVHKTLNYRPYRAAKQMKEEDSLADIARVQPLYIYPGDLNRRVRWESMRTRAIAADDYLAVYRAAHTSCNDAVKLVKNQLKNPLADKQPVLLLHVSQIQQTQSGDLVLVDVNGGTQRLGDHREWPPTTRLLAYLHEDQRSDALILAAFHQELASGTLLAQPLSVITREAVTRLL